jgi:hypothetical protein
MYFGLIDKYQNGGYFLDFSTVQGDHKDLRFSGHRGRDGVDGLAVQEISQEHGALKVKTQAVLKES